MNKKWYILIGLGVIVLALIIVLAIAIGNNSCKGQAVDAGSDPTAGPIVYYVGDERHEIDDPAATLPPDAVPEQDYLVEHGLATATPQTQTDAATDAASTAKATSAPTSGSTAKATAAPANTAAATATATAAAATATPYTAPQVTPDPSVWDSSNMVVSEDEWQTSLENSVVVSFDDLFGDGGGSETLQAGSYQIAVKIGDTLYYLKDDASFSTSASDAAKWTVAAANGGVTLHCSKGYLAVNGTGLKLATSGDTFKASFVSDGAFFVSASSDGSKCLHYSDGALVFSAVPSSPDDSYVIWFRAA